MTEFTFSTERYAVTERRAESDRSGAVRLLRAATCPLIGPRTTDEEISDQIAGFLRQGKPVRLGRHAIEPVNGGAGFRFWIVPLPHNEDGLRDECNFAAGARCTRTISGLNIDAEPAYYRIAYAFRETWTADADDLPLEIIKNA